MSIGNNELSPFQEKIVKDKNWATSYGILITLVIIFFIFWGLTGLHLPKYESVVLKRTANNTHLELEVLTNPKEYADNDSLELLLGDGKKMILPILSTDKIKEEQFLVKLEVQNDMPAIMSTENNQVNAQLYVGEELLVFSLINGI